MKKEHPDATRDGARSLLTMGFTQQALGGASHTAQYDVVDGDNDDSGDVDSDGDALMTSGGFGNSPAASNFGQPSVVIHPATDIVECGSSTVRTDYAAIGQQVLVVIEAARAAQVWPSAATLAILVSPDDVPAVVMVMLLLILLLQCPMIQCFCGLCIPSLHS